MSFVFKQPSCLAQVSLAGMVNDCVAPMRPGFEAEGRPCGFDLCVCVCVCLLLCPASHGQASDLC